MWNWNLEIEFKLEGKEKWNWKKRGGIVIGIGNWIWIWIGNLNLEFGIWNLNLEWILESGKEMVNENWVKLEEVYWRGLGNKWENWMEKGVKKEKENNMEKMRWRVEKKKKIKKKRKEEWKVGNGIEKE